MLDGDRPGRVAHGGMARVEIEPGALPHRADGRPVMRALDEGVLRLREGFRLARGHGLPGFRKGAAARRGFAEVWRFFRDEMGLDVDEARAFMAEGMLISTASILNPLQYTTDSPAAALRMPQTNTIAVSFTLRNDQ